MTKEDERRLAIIATIIVVSLVSLSLAFNFFTNDYGFQPDKEICNNPIEYEFEPSLKKGDKVFNICGGCDMHGYVIALDNENTVCKWKDWRDKTQEEIHCEQNPNDSEKCICEEQEVWFRKDGYPISTVNEIMYEKLKDEYKREYYRIYPNEASFEALSLCLKSRPKTKEEIFVRECVDQMVHKLRSFCYLDNFAGICEELEGFILIEKKIDEITNRILLSNNKFEFILMCQKTMPTNIVNQYDSCPEYKGWQCSDDFFNRLVVKTREVMRCAVGRCN